VEYHPPTTQVTRIVIFLFLYERCPLFSTSRTPPPLGLGTSNAVVGRPAGAPPSPTFSALLHPLARLPAIQRFAALSPTPAGAARRARGRHGGAGGLARCALFRGSGPVQLRLPEARAVGCGGGGDDLPGEDGSSWSGADWVQAKEL
jgi:hypothetical protein